MGTAQIQGQIWGARARDWADVQERVAIPLYEAVLNKTRVGEGTSVLDVGCGSGIFCEMAAKRGAQVSGVDAAESLLAIALERVSDGDFRTGEMEALPYAKAKFRDKLEMAMASEIGLKRLHRQPTQHDPQATLLR